MNSNMNTGLRILALAVVFSLFAAFVSASDAGAEGEAQKRLMARRAAKVDALRNLTETIYGVRIDSRTNVRDFITQSDVIRTRMETLIQGAREADYLEHPDGTAEVTVEVTLGQVEDILGKRIYYDYETFRATGFGAPSGSSGTSSALASTGDILRAKGYGVEPNDPAMRPAEKTLMAKRAAKIDALRNLTEQVYGVRIKSDSVVRDFVTRSDDMRAKVSALIQGSRVVSERKMPDGSYEAEVEIDLLPVRNIFR